MVRIGNQTNHQTSAVGYASSSSTPLHFGLGALATVPLIEVQWPSGKIQKLIKVAADRVLTVTEER
jgi:enediyne biosynthesis protein E4